MNNYPGLKPATLAAAQRYCEGYAEPVVQCLASFPVSESYRHIIVVPAYREEADFLIRLQALAEQEGETLVVLVINQPEEDDDDGPSQSLYEAGRLSGGETWRADNLQLITWAAASALLLVDCFTQGRRLPRRQGVGLARKMGCDLAAALLCRGQLRCEYLHTTDADAWLPSDYLRQVDGLCRESSSQGGRLPSAFVYPFQHRCDESALGQATRVYEQSLHYYVAGLRWAASPYAFHTIGSCLAVSLHAYCLARGFPKRAGGEDFYLLNKLAKLGPVKATAGCAIQLSARPSSRVPFGTGPAVEKILALPDAQATPSYNPRIFLELASLLRQLPQLWLHRHSYLSWQSQLSPPLQNACAALEFEKLARHLQRQVPRQNDAQAHLHNWFDGFRTLKLLHHLQAQHYPPVEFRYALAKAQELFGSIGSCARSVRHEDSFNPVPVQTGTDS